MTDERVREVLTEYGAPKAHIDRILNEKPEGFEFRDESDQDIKDAYDYALTMSYFRMIGINPS